MPSTLFLSPLFACVSDYRNFQQARSGRSAPWPAHICWTLHFTISRCHRRKKKNSSKPWAGIVSITWRSVCLCICVCVYIYEIYIYVCIWDLYMVETDNYGRNASDSHVTSSLGFFCMCVFVSLGFSRLVGWLVWRVFLVVFFFFPPQHWKQALELSWGV